MDVKCKSFNELSPEELYRIVQLRMEVFVVEQNCPYQDLDDKDQDAFHLWFAKNENIAAYVRILPQGVSYDNYVSIGRVVVGANDRGKKLGFQIMQEALHICQREFKKVPIKISAQTHLQSFYGALGFESIGGVYMEDDIPHRAMTLHYS